MTMTEAMAIVYGPPHDLRSGDEPKSDWHGWLSPESHEYIVEALRDRQFTLRENIRHWLEATNDKRLECAKRDLVTVTKAIQELTINGD